MKVNIRVVEYGYFEDYQYNDNSIWYIKTILYYINLLYIDSLNVLL